MLGKARKDNGPVAEGGNRTMTQDRCPGGGVLQDYLLGRLPEDQAARIDRHLDVC